jgi:hypothetical protein
LEIRQRSLQPISVYGGTSQPDKQDSVIAHSLTRNYSVGIQRKGAKAQSRKTDTAKNEPAPQATSARQTVMPIIERTGFQNLCVFAPLH